MYTQRAEELTVHGVQAPAQQAIHAGMKCAGLGARDAPIGSAALSRRWLPE